MCRTEDCQLLIFDFFWFLLFRCLRVLFFKKKAPRSAKGKKRAKWWVGFIIEGCFGPFVVVYFSPFVKSAEILAGGRVFPSFIYISAPIWSLPNFFPSLSVSWDRGSRELNTDIWHTAQPHPKWLWFYAVHEAYGRIRAVIIGIDRVGGFHILQCKRVWIRVPEGKSDPRSFDFVGFDNVLKIGGVGRCTFDNFLDLLGLSTLKWRRWGLFIWYVRIFPELRKGCDTGRVDLLHLLHCWWGGLKLLNGLVESLVLMIFLADSEDYYTRVFYRKFVQVMSLDFGGFEIFFSTSVVSLQGFLRFVSTEVKAGWGQMLL